VKRQIGLKGFLSVTEEITNPWSLEELVCVEALALAGDLIFSLNIGRFIAQKC
jgi:hypothetical protein